MVWKFRVCLGSYGLLRMTAFWETGRCVKRLAPCCGAFRGLAVRSVQCLSKESFGVFRDLSRVLLRVSSFLNSQTLSHVSSFLVGPASRGRQVSTSGGGKHAFSLSSATCFRGDESPREDPSAKTYLVGS